MRIVKKISYTLASLAVFAPFAALNAAGTGFQTPAGTNLPAGSLLGILTSAMNWLLTVVGILGVVGFVIAGIIYLTAAGDEEQINRGKKAMVWSIVGVIVALLGVVIIKAVQSLLGGNDAAF